MSFEKLTRQQAQKYYRQLYKRVKFHYQSPVGFDQFHSRLFSLKPRFIRDRLQAQSYVWMKNKAPQVLVTHFHDPSPKSFLPHTFGLVLASDNLSQEEADQFLQKLVTELSPIQGPVVGPINGHMNLGFSYPSAEAPLDDLSFLTASSSPALDRIFHHSQWIRPWRRYEALRVAISESLKEKVYSELKNQPAELTSRPLSLQRFKREVMIYNDLVNRCMKEHPFFNPLTAQQEWDLMRLSWPLLDPELFRFLVFKGREIGFCMAIPDYNQIFQTGQDLKNIIRSRTQKQKIRRGRIIYSGILPEFRGQGLFKYVRHPVLKEMIDRGYTEIESSYVDQDNINSKANVASTGGQLSHQYHLYQIGESRS